MPVVNHHSARRTRGMLSLEAMVGIVLLLFVFITCLHLTQQIWLRLRVEQEATEVARLCARVPASAGASQQWLAPNGTTRVEVWWGDHNVLVRLSATDGRVLAERLVVREVP